MKIVSFFLSRCLVYIFCVDNLYLISKFFSVLFFRFTSRLDHFCNLVKKFGFRLSVTYMYVSQGLIRSSKRRATNHTFRSQYSRSFLSFSFHLVNEKGTQKLQYSLLRVFVRSFVRARARASVRPSIRSSVRSFIH